MGSARWKSCPQSVGKALWITCAYLSASPLPQGFAEYEQKMISALNGLLPALGEGMLQSCHENLP